MHAAGVLYNVCVFCGGKTFNAARASVLLLRPRPRFPRACNLLRADCRGVGGGLRLLKDGQNIFRDARRYVRQSNFKNFCLAFCAVFRRVRAPSDARTEAVCAVDILRYNPFAHNLSSVFRSLGIRRGKGTQKCGQGGRYRAAALFGGDAGAPYNVVRRM